MTFTSSNAETRALSFTGIKCQPNWLKKGRGKKKKASFRTFAEINPYVDRNCFSDFCMFPKDTEKNNDK